MHVSQTFCIIMESTFFVCNVRYTGELTLTRHIIFKKVNEMSGSSHKITLIADSSLARNIRIKL